MADADFLEQQQEHRLDAHVAPINGLVGKLRDPDRNLWLPEVAPMHGGIDARVLSVLRDPGPKTQADTGSGFLSVENDDPTAAAQLASFQEHGISPRDVLPWNAYPWYINRKPRAAELEAGAQVLCELVDLVPTLRVVLLQGNDAVDAWKRVLKRRPGLVGERGLEVVESIHPGRQALFTPDPEVREARKYKQRRAFERTGEILAELGTAGELTSLL